LESGNQEGAQKLNSQSQTHATFIQGGIGGVGSPELPEV